MGRQQVGKFLRQSGIFLVPSGPAQRQEAGDSDEAQHRRQGTAEEGQASALGTVASLRSGDGDGGCRAWRRLPGPHLTDPCQRLNHPGGGGKACLRIWVERGGEEGVERGGPRGILVR